MSQGPSEYMIKSMLYCIGNIRDVHGDNPLAYFAWIHAVRLTFQLDQYTYIKKEHRSVPDGRPYNDQNYRQFPSNRRSYYYPKRSLG